MSHASWRIVSDEPGQPLVIQDVGPWVHRMTVTNDAEWVVSMLWDDKRLVPGRRLFYFDSERVLDELLVVGTGRFGGFQPLTTQQRAPYVRLVPTREIGKQAYDYARHARGGTGQPYGSRFQSRLITAWMQGYRGERWKFGTNFEAPLQSAHRDGREVADLEMVVKP